MAIAAVGQICSTASLAHNLEQCVKLVAKAAVGGAKVRLFFPKTLVLSRHEGRDMASVGANASLHTSRNKDIPTDIRKVLFLPEAADYIASSPQESLSLAQPESTSPFVLGLQEAAKKHSLAVNVGIHVPAPPSPASPGGGPRLLNRSLWIDADGSVNAAATYDKLHLFDYGALRESATVQAGPALTAPFPTPVGRVGSLICFDLRFPEPALALTHPAPRSPFLPENGGAGVAQVLLYPSAFTVKTGLAHWETLLRARAIETQSWVVAAAQVGAHNAKRSSYGHSMVVDPWGAVRLELGGVDADGRAEEGAEGAIGFVDVDLDEWTRIREGMPLVRRT